MTENSKFELTDDGNMPQWVKKIDEDNFMVVEVDPIFGVFFIKENNITISDYSEEEILEETQPFGYESLEQIEKDNGDAKNQIIAECFAENRFPSTSDTEYKCSTRNEVIEKLKEEYGIEWTLGENWFEPFEE